MDPNEMSPEEIQTVYGDILPMSTVTHVISVQTNVNHDRFTIEMISEDSKRLSLPFTQSALRMLFAIVKEDLKLERQRAN